MYNKNREVKIEGPATSREGNSVGVGPGDSPTKTGDEDKEKVIEEQKKDTILQVSKVLKQVKLARKPLSE